VKVAVLLVGESVSAAVRRFGWPKFSRGGDEHISLAAFSSAGWRSAKGWACPRQVGVEIVSVWLLFRLAFILNLRLARVGCVFGR